ncbi:hypothetical protein V8F20_008254 [Naviculisporaceae sp. PSN 640]
MVSSGHQIGIHGWSHVNMSALDAETRYHEVHDLEVTLYNILGKYPTYFRPPFGDCNAECIAQLEGMGYHVVKWDKDTMDWVYNTEETWWTVDNRLTIDKLWRNLGFQTLMMLLHDVHEMTARNILPRLLRRIRVTGRDKLSLTVGECLHDAPQNWYRIPGADWDPNPSQRYWDVKADEQAWYKTSENNDGDE